MARANGSIACIVGRPRSLLLLLRRDVRLLEQLARGVGPDPAAPLGGEELLARGDQLLLPGARLFCPQFMPPGANNAFFPYTP